MPTSITPSCAIAAQDSRALRVQDTSNFQAQGKVGFLCFAKIIRKTARCLLFNAFRSRKEAPKSPVCCVIHLILYYIYFLVIMVGAQTRTS